MHWLLDPLSAGGPPPMQTPAPQVPAPQLEQAIPLEPHAVVAPPGAQVPVESQQPTQFDVVHVAGAPQVWLFPSHTPPLQFMQPNPE